MRTAEAGSLTLQRELARKSLHLLWSVVPLWYALGAQRRTLLFVLSAGSLLAILIEVARGRIPRVAHAFARATRPLLRAHEDSRWSGATWLLLSFLIVVAVFPPRIAIAAMWAVSVGDAMAALVGRTLGGYRPGRSPKTLTGSSACALSTMVGALVIAGLPLRESILGGVIAAAAEWPSGPLDDNLRIGLGVGAGILLSHMAFS